MRKRTPILALLFVVALVVYALVRREWNAFPKNPTLPGEPQVAAISRPVEAQNPSPQQSSPAVPALSPAAAAAFPEPTMRQHVFRLQLDRGNCTLEKMEQVSGAFRRERFQPWQTGMLCCRLIAEDGRILSERTLQSPDQVCVVLDPNVDLRGPVASRFTSDGPATFQVRFPDISDAVRLEVHRIATETRPVDGAAPIGQLVASIAIPTK